MAQNTPPTRCSDLDELLGAEIEPATVQAAREALEAHEDLAVVVEVKAPDAATVLHTSGLLRKTLSAVTDFYIGGELLPTGHVLGFRAALTLPEDPSRVLRYEGGFRFLLGDADGCELAVALFREGE